MTKDLTTGSPFRVILMFTLPVMLGNLFQQLYGLADTIVVGRFLGVRALAAVGSTGSVNFLILGFVIGLCCGYAIPIAQLFGAHDYADMRRHVANAAWLCIGFSVVLTVSTVLLTRPILVLMQTPPDILDGAATYIGCIFAGIPFVFLYNMVAATMRALGDSRTPLYFLILTSFLNIVLDLVFILVIPLGVLGAALATDLSQAVSGVLSLVYMRRHFKVLMLQPGEGRLDKKACLRLSGMGLPMGLQYSITAIGSVILQSAVNLLGSGAVAAVTAAGRTGNLLTSPYESLGTAIATYSGQNLGAARLDRVRAGVRSARILSLVYSVLVVLALRWAGPAILSLFLDGNAEPAIAANAQKYLLWNVLFYLLLGELIIHRYAIQGVGYSNLAVLAGVSEMVARMVAALVLVPWLQFFGACLANAMAWGAACLFLFPAYLWTMRHLSNRIEAARLVVGYGSSASAAEESPSGQPKLKEENQTQG